LHPAPKWFRHRLLLSISGCHLHPRTGGTGVAVADDGAVAFVNAIYFAEDGPGYAGDAFGAVSMEVAYGLVSLRLKIIPSSDLHLLCTTIIFTL